MWYREFFPRSRPRQAKGGIKAQSKRGQFGESWWAKRWIEVLESFHVGGRLQRGRTYARGGQVLSIDVEKGEVKAKVQGSQAKPYAVRIQLAQLTAKEWDKLVKALSGQALFLAKLLAGELPQEVEKVFDDAGLSLFPKKLGDLKTQCSCPDYSNPCKHIAAVYYLLAEEFDRDPYLLFRLRGLSREELTKRLQAAQPAEEAAPPTPAEPAEPLPLDVKAFWSPAQPPADLFGDLQPPPTAAAWPRRLGNFPFWRGQERFLDALEPLYRQAGEKGMHVFLEERKE